jgi:hypothetical protein
VHAVALDEVSHAQRPERFGRIPRAVVDQDHLAARRNQFAQIVHGPRQPVEPRPTPPLLQIDVDTPRAQEPP